MTDPEDVLYAGDLRAMGAEVPAEIPDCAWVLRSSVKSSFVVDRTHSIMKTGEIRGTTTLTFSAPWSWVECSVTIGP